MILGSRHLLSTALKKRMAETVRNELISNTSKEMRHPGKNATYLVQFFRKYLPGRFLLDEIVPKPIRIRNDSHHLRSGES